MGFEVTRIHSGASPRSHPYESILSSSASSSSSSVFSDAPSQQSGSSSVLSQSDSTRWDSDEWGMRSQILPPVPPETTSFAPVTRASTFPQFQPSACREQNLGKQLPPLRTDFAAPLEQRQHPRRSSTTATRPPQLVRQAERKGNFVDLLVDSATMMVEVIWPLSVPSSRCETASGRNVLPLRTFIQETLRRSRTSYSTLQVALYYLILIKGHVPKHDFTMEQKDDCLSYRALQCGRRMFLAALILASKYLQDRNYSARAWSKISGLKVCEINTNEAAFLAAVNWKLHITNTVWERWSEVVLRQTQYPPPSSPGASVATNNWRQVLPLLTPELENVVVAPKTPVTPVTPARLNFGPNMLRSPLPFSDGCTSSESTPTPTRYQVPRFLEPKPELVPPTPSLARLGTLPTPALTPQSTVNYTPAVGGMAYGSRRPSMCTAMAQAQSSALARSCVDQFASCSRNGLEAYHFSSRRPSLAPSVSSSASSPESMITDHSRTSRASSIMSVSSANWALSQTDLPRLATVRNLRLPYPAPSKAKDTCEVSSTEPASSPDLESFHIVTPVRTESPQAILPSPSSSTSSRKRGRSSVDLQNNVRHILLNSRSTSCLRSSQTVLPDRTLSQTFLLPSDTSRNGPKGLQSPKTTVPERRMPYQKDLGRKRTCCGSEAAQTLRRESSGIWKGLS